jgi:hypothetical protein
MMIVMDITNPRTGHRYFLISNGPQTLGVMEAKNAASAEESIRLHLSAGQTFGALSARPAEPHEAIAWHLGCALWAAKHHHRSAWNELRGLLQEFFDRNPECQPK